MFICSCFQVTNFKAPYELEVARSMGGSLSGNPACSAISSPDAIKENFPLIQNYSSQTAAGIPGEQEVIEERENKVISYNHNIMSIVLAFEGL